MSPKRCHRDFPGERGFKEIITRGIAIRTAVHENKDNVTVAPSTTVPDHFDRYVK